MRSQKLPEMKYENEALPKAWRRKLVNLYLGARHLPVFDGVAFAEAEAGQLRQW